MKRLTPPPNARKIRSVTWTFRGETLGQGSVPPIYLGSKLYFPPSRVFVCPACGEAWASAKVEGISFAPIPRFCPTHGGGSLLLSEAPHTYPKEVAILSLRFISSPTYWTAFPVNNGVYDEYFSYRP